MQDELNELLRLRPRPGRYDPDQDPTAWGGLGRDVADAELLTRWHSAQQTCDALLKRVMRRDPDSLLGTISN